MDDFMEDISFDVNEIKETGTFGFDNDFALEDEDDNLIINQDEPAEQVNIPLPNED